LVASAAGARKERKDTIKVATVDFVDSGHDLAPQPPPSISEMLLRQTGTIVNAATILVVALLLIWFGLRPATKAILRLPAEGSRAAPELAAFENLPELEGSDGERDALPNWTTATEGNLIEDLTNSSRRSPQRQLVQIVEFDEAQAVAILKQWLHQGGRE
jgi:flagellar M-ring protein FliF